MILPMTCDGLDPLLRQSSAPPPTSKPHTLLVITIIAIGPGKVDIPGSPALPGVLFCLIVMSFFHLPPIFFTLPPLTITYVRGLGNGAVTGLSNTTTTYSSAHLHSPHPLPCLCLRWAWLHKRDSSFDVCHFIYSNPIYLVRAFPGLNPTTVCC